MNFDFLKNTTLTKVEATTKAGGGKGREAIERNPTNGASLRLFKDGSIYPSMEAVGKYDLEYHGNTGNGFDVIDSRQWDMYPKDAQQAVFIAAVPKKSGLVDMFGQGREGASVMTQGAKTFGPQLITMLEEVYGVELFKNSKYVDLAIMPEVLEAEDGIYNVPKTTAKGENKGQLTTKRRENIMVNPLALFYQPVIIDAEMAEHMAAKMQSSFGTVAPEVEVQEMLESVMAE